MGKPSKPLSAQLPPLILGTATFNYQFNEDPYALPSTAIVERALDNGIRAFDTSPYYGPSEKLLGQALTTDYVRQKYPRESYQILTKIGRVASSCFDYSPEWVRKSVKRSLKRFSTTYLDVVYCHDIEFVTPAEVLAAVKELRKIRDEDQSVHYIGISGYPVDVLCEVAELVSKETGEPLDVVQSYANHTLQNTRLKSRALPRLLHAQVDVVTNSSPLGMGLLRHVGVPIGAMGDFHPSSEGLRKAIGRASQWLAESENKKIESEALRFSLGAWLIDGSRAGGSGLIPGVTDAKKSPDQRLGVSVIGVSNVEELMENISIWKAIVMETSEDTTQIGVKAVGMEAVASKFQEILGDWYDHAWDSPGSDFVNEVNPEHDTGVNELE
ncbi:mitochondrial import inner membrane translocase subunit TIM16 [Ascosphaera pollenicola]|nr:mitochondrial import inner membrane translocase subunit TIM16 [Ascosphaera pollenicola]